MKPVENKSKQKTYTQKIKNSTKMMMIVVMMTMPISRVMLDMLIKLKKR